MEEKTIKQKVTIVIPVYADWASLKDCIESLKKCIDFQKNKVLLINDCGPDVEYMEKSILSAITGFDGFLYYRNKKNLGFVKTCNRAVNELDETDNDILLLNSDTKVTQGFLEEMQNVLYCEKNIGAVSPRSNNATICTIPISAIKEKGIEAARSYRLFMKYNNKFPKYSIAPTAHGFCILIRRSLIDKYGLFDTVFGKGYGEEVDFCRRIKNHGWLSAISNQSFVFHLEARSFSLETKAKLIEQSSKIINKRYPEYKQEVTSYINQRTNDEADIFKIHRINRKRLTGGSVPRHIKSLKSYLIRILRNSSM